MNGMLGTLELLSLTRLDAEQRHTLTVTRESGRSLLRIVDDILDFSKIEAGMLEIRAEPASINKLVEEVQNLYARDAASRGLALTRQIDPRISPALMVDAMRVRQILNNLVSNALKFTRHGSVHIKAELLERTGGHDRLQFSVVDSGLGISEEHQKRLFNPFDQGDADTARHFGGTGLGLAICRRLATMMGGSVAVQSELGVGTTVLLTLSLPIADLEMVSDAMTLPQDPDTAATEASQEVEEHLPNAIGAEAVRRLLLVDDHPVNRMLLQRQVSTLGHASETAENGVEALEKWKAGGFDLIVTDCHMPEMDGYALAHEIRRLEAGNGGRRIPIIACTANALGGEAEKCLAAGMDDILVKPVGLAPMREKLEQWLPAPGDPAVIDLGDMHAAHSAGDAERERKAASGRHPPT